MPRFIDVGGLIASAAVDTGHQPIRAMKLHEFLVRGAGELVQAVDVLGDQAEELAALLEIADRVVGGVRLDRLEKLLSRLLELPVLHPRRLTREKILKQ